MRKTLSKILIAILMISVFLVPVVQVNAQLGGTAGGATSLGQTTDATNKAKETSKDIDEIGCGWWPGTWFTNCLASFFYYIIWTPVSWLVVAAGTLLDFFIFYSIGSEPYQSDFVEKAWAAVRDVANVLFILALLYIGLKTVLSMNVSNNKRLIANVIIFALLINFSLFVTKVVIDASNILTKVFYAQITPQDASGKPLDDPNSGKSISVGLVDKFDPQEVLGKPPVNDIAGFMILTFISLLLMLYMIFMFLSVALLFVARVASLWIAMIFSPLAFVSYAVPFNIPGFGHQKWWDLLLKNAFLAPIFVFFLYIVILFGGFLKDINYQTGSTYWGDQMLKSVIGFIIIYALLKKAKEIAVEYSGEMGAGIVSGAKILGGVALGAVAGGAAFAGTRFLGGYASRQLATKGEALREQAKQGGLSGYWAKTQLKQYDKATKRTFDFRQTKLGEFAGRQTGMDFQSVSAVGLGSKQGGLRGAQERETAKIEEEKELYKTTMSDPQVQAWSKRRMDMYESDKKNATDPKAYEEEYIKKYGEVPRFYSSAQELNNSRMKAFSDNFYSRGLLGALAYESVKGELLNEKNYESSSEYSKKHKEKAEEKARQLKGKSFNKEEFETGYAKEDPGYYDKSFDESIAREINDRKIQNKKLAVGAAIAIGTGGIAPMLIPGMIGAGAVGVGESYGVMGGDGGVRDQIAKNIEKESVQVQKISERIASATERLKKYQDSFSQQKDRATNFYNNATYKNMIEVRKDNKGNIISIEKINNDQVLKEIATRESRETGIKVELESIERQLGEIKDTDADAMTRRSALEQKKKDVGNELAKIKVELNEINEIKGIKEKIENTAERVASTEKEVVELTGKKDAK